MSKKNQDGNATKNKENKMQDNTTPDEFAFPKAWTLFGPIGKYDPEPDFAGMNAIPKELTIAGKRLAGQKAAFTDNRLDLGALLGGHEVGKTAYLLASVEAEKATEIELGAGADWWMKWWVDGAVACDTLATGNNAHPPSVLDHRFTARLKAGRNLVAVKVVSGSGGFVLAAGGQSEFLVEAEMLKERHRLKAEEARALDTAWRAEIEEWKKAEFIAEAEFLKERDRRAARARDEGDEEWKKARTRPAANMIEPDVRALVSSSDIAYQEPTVESVEGQPIGNGRMGTLVWTTPGALHFQINRSDVFAVDNSHRGDQQGPADCCGACAQVTVEVGGEAFAPAGTFEQRLSLYDAETVIRGTGVDVKCFVVSDQDVLVVEVDDRRPNPPPLRVTLAMWRAPEVRTGEHLARLSFERQADRVVLRQRFEEREYRCASAVAVGIVGRPTTLDDGQERTRTLVETAGTALRLLETAAGQTLESLRQRHVRWWHQFWSRTFVQFASPDGLAEFMERLRNVQLYCMASTSRGPLPPKFNGMLFTTEGDRRDWGSQFWFWNTNLIYYPLFAADACDLIEPYFDMYWRMLPACQTAARQRWGLEGAFYPETIPFNGPAALSEDVATEFQDVMLGRKPAWELSERAIAECSFDAQLHATAATRERGKDHYQLGRYTWISHIATGVLDLAQQFWWRYRYTGDCAWLRDRAYPLLRAGMEFYRSLARKGEDGRYHLYPTNARERFWGVRDSIVDLAALRGVGPLAIKAAELLGQDEELRGKWRELLDNLAPYPVGSEPEAQALTAGVLAPDTWAAARRGDVNGSRNLEDVWESPLFPSEHVTLASEDAELLAQVARVCRLVGYEGWAHLRTAIRVARSGDAEHMPGALAAEWALCPDHKYQLPSGLCLQSGVQAMTVEPQSAIAMGLQEALMQSLSPRPGEPELILLFPALPGEWDGAFRLLARGGFLVTSQRRGGSIRFVQIDSRVGETCRLRNPWGQACVLVDADGCRRGLSGAVLQFDTRPDGRYLVYPANLPEPQPERLPAPRPKPAAFRFTLPDPMNKVAKQVRDENNRTLEGRIGKPRGSNGHKH